MIGYSFFYFNEMVLRIHQSAILPLSPPKHCVDLDNVDLSQLLSEKKCFFIRWESDFDTSSTTSWWHVIKEKDVVMADLSSNTRSKVRRGEKNFISGPLSKEELLIKGFEVYRSAFSRYSTHEKMLSNKDFVEAIKALPEKSEFWGVWKKDDNSLVAFSENFVESNVCFYNSIWFDPKSLRKYSSYVLFYEMNYHYLAERDFEYVSDGARSLSHDTQIHDFLESKFGFRKAYAQLNIVYAPWLKILVFTSYPFRALIRRIPINIFKKVSILLKQEEIRRECSRDNHNVTT